MIKIKKTVIAFEKETFLAPFGFKGGYLNGAWQTVALMESENGKQGLGLGTQSTLWSDAEIFINNSEQAGNEMMYRITEEALRLAKEIPFETPVDLLEKLVPPAYEYGKKITGKNNLRLTFALNALVAVDNAAWQLYCAEKGITGFDQMVPAELKSGLPYRHRELASIPLMTYGVPLKDIITAVNDGCFFLKIKIGSDPDKDGDQEKMVRWDKERLSAIHEAVKDREIPYTEDGRIPYYLDANGRYDSKERLMQLLDHARKIGALERIMIMEEPFPEEYRVDVRDIPVRLAADESAHSDKDALERIEMGYGAIALKPIAKTMSMSLKIAKIAAEKKIPCFCADLTVNPILVDWNKNVAARLAPLPGMKIGVLETNGHQNYKNWEAMRSYHTRHDASWTKTVRGLFQLDDDFYASSGGILEPSEHYRLLVTGK
ncbi:MAG: L-alanine-DL-glutamate epimerase [Candidatus Omnitrophica bacterium]|nr:L-alanine-DL-glutamate epimerase [Candidatus Omnitrophota bacterium]